MSNDLADLIRMLIEEEGLSEQEAARVAAATVRSRSTSLSTRNSNSSMDRERTRGTDLYGEETPQQAKARWLEQEKNDPNGLFSGGATSGGVFGSGPIALDNYDPDAVARTVNLQSQIGQMQTQAEMLQLIKEMREDRRLPTPEPRKQLNEHRGMKRLLGRKKK